MFKIEYNYNMNDDDIYNLSANIGMYSINYLDLNLNDALKFKNYFMISEAYNKSFKDFYNAFKGIKTIIIIVKNFIKTINNEYNYCLCGELSHMDDLYYQSGSNNGYYHLINNYSEYFYNLEYCNLHELSNYIYENIASYWDNEYYNLNDGCLNDLLEEVQYHIDDYVELELEDEEPIYIKAYHYSKNKIKDFSNTIYTLGYEIEHEFSQFPPFEAVKNFICDYNGDAPFWCESDGSLNAVSCEWVSNILDIEYIINNKNTFKDFFKVVSPYLDCSDNCGGHLHISKAYFKNNKAIIRLIEFGLNNKDLFKDISGRSNNAFEYAEFNGNNYNYSNNEIYSNKYSFINIKEDTVEFRLFYTYKSWETMLRRAQICYILAFLANNNNLSVRAFYEMILFYEMTSPVTLKWYLNKIKKYLD